MKEKNLNYNFKVQKEPKKRMGKESYAGMPDRPIYMRFKDTSPIMGGTPDGLVNEVDVSGIYENERSE